MNSNRRRFATLLQKYRQGEPVWSDMDIWLREMAADDVIWGFEKAVMSKLFSPIEVWLMMMRMYATVNPSHLPALERLHSVMAILRDGDPTMRPAPSWSMVSFAEVLCDFELILKRNGMRRRQIVSLRSRNWGDLAHVITILQLWAGGGNWHVEIPSGLVSPR